MQQQLNQFKIEYFNNLENVVNRPDLLRFNMKVSTAATSSSAVEAAAVEAAGSEAALTAYRLERYFWDHIAAGEAGIEASEAGENDTYRTPAEDETFRKISKISKISDDLAAPGTVLLLNDEKRLVLIEQTENVLETMKGYTQEAEELMAAYRAAQEAQRQAEQLAATAEEVEAPDAEEAVQSEQSAANIDTEETLEEAANSDTATVDDEESDVSDMADTVGTVSIDDAKAAEDEDEAERVDAVDDEDATDDEEAALEAARVEARHDLIIGWQYVIIFLTDTADTLDFHYLYCLALAARRYKVLKPSNTSQNAQSSAQSTSQTTAQSTAQTSAQTAGITVDTEENVPMDTIDTEETETNPALIDTETVADSDVTPEISPESTEAVSDVSAVSKLSESDQISLTKAAIFITRYLFYCEVFVMKTAVSLFAASSLGVAGLGMAGRGVRDLTGTKLFLISKSKGVQATGVLTSPSAKQILVKAGSTVSSHNRLPLQKGQTSSASLRQKLIDDGVIIDYQFISDYEFASTSAAASVILGQSASGMNTWKDENGRKLETLLGR